jgi:hypothetical protein
MELTLAELNEVYYCLTKVSEVKNTSLINYKLVNEIIDKVRDEIEQQVIGSGEDYKASLQQDEQRYENQHK